MMFNLDNCSIYWGCVVAALSNVLPIVVTVLTVVLLVYRIRIARKELKNKDEE